MHPPDQAQPNPPHRPDVARTATGLVASAPVGIALLDAALRFVDVNAALAEISGLGIEAHRGRRLEDVVPDLAPRIAPVVASVLHTGEATTVEVSGRTAATHDEVRTWIATFYPVRDAQGAPTGIGVAVIEISERKRMEQALRESEARLQLALGAAQMGTWEHDFRTDTVQWSPTLEPMLGLPAGTLGGTFDAFLARVEPADRAAIESAVAVAMRNGGSYEVEFRVVRPGGEVRWIRGTGRIFFDEDGRPARLTGVGTDVTERRQADEALREQHAIIETVQQVGLALSAELDPEKLVQAVTDAATRLVGAAFGAFFYNVLDERGEAYTLYTLSGAPREAFARFPMPRNTALFGPTFRGEAVIRIADVKQDPRHGRNPPYNGMPTGHLPVRSYLAAAVVSRSGETIGGLFFGHPDPGVFSERDEQIVVGLAAQAAIAMDNARLYDAERRARAEGEAANRAKDEFLATLSHELRSPLSAASMWASLLRSGKLDAAKTARAIEAIDRSTTTQTTLIEDLLDVSRIISDKLPLEHAPVDLDAAVEAALDAVRAAAEAKGITLMTTLTPEIRVWGDGARLRQAARNLLSNAVKFTPPGGHVTVTLARTDGHAHLVVRDDGEGIAPALLPHVFERFRQGDSTSTRAHGGLGLGLTIASHLVERHGGIITAASEGTGKGATFSVSLPVIPPHVAGVQRAVTPAPPLATRALANLRILVVDDDPEAREAVAVVLGGSGAEVTTVATVTEGRAAIGEASPHVIVTDLTRPGVDGRDLLRALRRDGAAIPALALTAHAGLEDGRRALAAGFDGYLAMPVDPARLVTTVARVATTGARPVR